MKLDEVSSGALYVETKVWYMYLRGDAATRPVLTTCVGRVVRGSCEACVGLPVLDELFYRLLLARMRDATGGHPLETLRADWTVAIEHGPAIDRALWQLVLLPPVPLVGVDPTDFTRMLENIESYRLLPRDALHIALMQRVHLPALASDDTDVDRVSTITRQWVSNRPQE